MSVFAGFKEFIARGNAVDMAVGIVVGGAFTAVVNSVVDNLVNPLLASVLHVPTLKDWWVPHIGTTAFHPGAVIDAIIKFLIVAAALYFCIILPLNKLAATARRTKTQDVAAPSAEEQLLTEIRDLLREDAGRSWPYAGG